MKHKPKSLHMVYDIVIIDHTTDATPSRLRPGADLLNHFAFAWLEQINGEFAEAHGKRDVKITLSTLAQRRPNQMGMNLRDAIPEAPQALAYHQCVNGIPDMEFGMDLFDALDGNGETFAPCGSHELLELLLDSGANGWKDRQDPSGEMDSEEACDFVQNTRYQASNGVWLSNFVLGNFFLPGSSGPWDYLQYMKTPHDVSHGYGIVAPAPSDVKQIQGRSMLTLHGAGGGTPAIVGIKGTLSAKQLARKRHPYSRTYRRGVRFGL